MADRPFTVIEGTPAPDTPRERQRARLRASPKLPGRLACHRCSGNAFLVVLVSPETRNGKVRGGQKNHICATCFQQGQYVVVAY